MTGKRMPFWAELRCLVAAHLLNWTFELMKDELTTEGLEAFAAFIKSMKNDPRYDTIRMGAPRRPR